MTAETIRIYLNGHRAPGQPRPHADSFAPYAAYVRQRAGDDRHLRGDRPAPRGHRTRIRRQLLRVHPGAAQPRHHRRLRDLQTMETARTRPATASLARAAPFRVTPLAGETIASYLARVAAGSYLPLRAVTDVLPPGSRPRPPPATTSRNQGRRSPVTHAALPCSPGPPKPRYAKRCPRSPGTVTTGARRSAPPLACQRCAARHGQHEPVPVHLPAHQRSCERHRTWLGRTAQIDVTTAPDITAASKKASRLAREYGITRLVLAETTARQETAGGPDTRRRAAALAPANPALDPGHPDTAEAAAYPEAIKVAAALLRTPGALPGGPE